MHRQVVIYRDAKPSLSRFVALGHLITIMSDNGIDPLPIYRIPQVLDVSLTIANIGVLFLRANLLVNH